MCIFSFSLFHCFLLIESFYIVFLADFEPVTEGNQCDTGIYTKSPCSPWKDISETDCKQKCLDNELKTPGCTPKKCVYIQYKSDVKNCHFADDSCAVTDKGLTAYFLWKKTSKEYCQSI